MNIQTVAENLKNTIAGKELLLAEKQKAWEVASFDEESALWATINFLEINIAELRRILTDVEICCMKATEDSWALNPDRSGGAFTDEEINRSNEWH